MDDFDGYSGEVDLMIKEGKIVIHHNDNLLFSESINADTSQLVELDKTSVGFVVDASNERQPTHNVRVIFSRFIDTTSPDYTLMITIPKYPPLILEDVTQKYEAIWCSYNLTDNERTRLINYLLAQDINVNSLVKHYIYILENYPNVKLLPEMQAILENQGYHNTKVRAY